MILSQWHGTAAGAAQLGNYSGVELPSHVSAYGGYYYGDLGTRGIVGWVALPFVDHVDHTMDLGFLRDRCYPLLIAGADFFESYLTYHAADQTYTLDNACALEGCTLPHNPSEQGKPQQNVAMTLGWIRSTFKALLRFSVMLGVDEGRRPTWQKILKGLAAFPTTESKNQTVFDECEHSGDFGGNHRYPVVYYGHIHPAAQITRRSASAEMLQTARNTIEQINTMNGWVPDNGLCMAWPPAAVVTDNASHTSLMMQGGLLRVMSPNFVPQIQAGCVSEQAGATQAVNDLMLASYDGLIELFPAGWVAGSNASFTTLRARGAFLISASWSRGAVLDGVKLLSEAGSDVAMINPFSSLGNGELPMVTELGTGTVVKVSRTADGYSDAFGFATASGKSYTISRRPAGTLKTDDDLMKIMPLKIHSTSQDEQALLHERKGDQQGIVDVTDYGAVPDGETNNAEAIARAAAHCVQLGGCTLRFPPRSPSQSVATVYRSSSFVVPSHTTLFVPPGVVLRGTETDADNIDVWPTQKTVEWPSQPCMSCPYACGGGCGPAKRAWLFIQNATNVTVTGGGTLHGGGHWWWCARADNERKGVPAHCASKFRLREMCPPRMIHVLDSRDVRISDVRIMWSPFWTTHVQFSRDVEISNVSVWNPHNASFSSANGDGFDISSSTNVHIHDSVIDVSDDASAVRAGSGWAGQQSEIAPGAFGGRCSTENVTFERIEVRNGHGIGRCGEDARGGLRNITWKDIVVRGNGPTQRGGTPPNAIRFEASPTDGGLYEGITFERVTGSHVGFGFSMLENHLTYKDNSSGGPYPKVVPGGPFPVLAPQRPVLRNVVVRDVHLLQVETVGKLFTLIDAPIENFTLSNITIEPKAGAKKPGWTCAAWDKGTNGKEEHGRVHACGASAAEAITPALAQPGGCAFSCAKTSIKTDDVDGNGSAIQGCTAIKSATAAACEPIVIATFPSDAVLPPDTNPWNASAHIWASIQEESSPLSSPLSSSSVRVGGYFDNGSVSFRFTPSKAGRYMVTLHRRDDLPAPPPCNFVVVASPKPNCGFVRVGKNQQHFAVSEQQSWFGIGENLAWVTPVAGWNSHGSPNWGAGVLKDWDPFLRNLSAHGATFIRVWLTDSAWDDMAVETALGNYSVANTARIESLLTSCHALGIKVLMTIESFNYLCVCKKFKPQGGGCTSPCYFDKFVYNVDHPGGFLHNPVEFFNSSLADAYFQMRLRYLVSRYSAFPSVFAYEFFNEVDITDDFSAETQAAWFSRMAGYVRSIDGFNHPISTSFGSGRVYPEVWQLQSADFSMMHSYGASDPLDAANDVQYWSNRLSKAYGKPTFVAEFGTGPAGAGEAEKQDTTGVSLHNGLWSSIMSVSALGASTWFWDSWVQHDDLYSQFEAASKFVATVPWQDFRWAALGSDVKVCKDVTPGGNYTCAQQKSFGQCKSSNKWMVGRCCRTCWNCSEACTGPPAHRGVEIVPHVRLLGMLGQELAAAHRHSDARQVATMAVLWIQNTNNTWSQQNGSTTAEKMPLASVKLGQLALPGEVRGKFEVTYINTTTGAETRGKQVICQQGSAQCVLEDVPEFTTDVAVKLSGHV
jgi:polygalacturonase